MPVTKVFSDCPFVCTIKSQRIVGDGIVKIKAISPEEDAFIMQTDKKMKCAKDEVIFVRKFQEISDNDGKRRVIRPIEWRTFSHEPPKVYRQPEWPQATKRQLQCALGAL